MKNRHGRLRLIARFGWNLESLTKNQAGSSQLDTFQIWSLLKPSQLILYSAILGLILYRSQLGKGLLISVSTLLIACTLLPISALLTVPLEARFPRPVNPPHPDGIIVLAGSEQADLTAKHGEPMLNKSADRLTTFLRLAHLYPSARLVHAGSGRKYNDIGQSEVARMIILGTGIDEERIFFANRSRNTCQDARLAFEELAPESEETWLLVTSAYHMPRAVACFRAVNWNVIPYPTDYMYASAFQISSLAESLNNIDLATHEWIGLLYYRITGQTSELYPTLDRK